MTVRRTWLAISTLLAALVLLGWVGGSAPEAPAAPASAPAAAAPAAASDSFLRSDAHFHYLNFVQETQGTEALLREMDRARVEHVVFWGMPLVKKWHPDDPVRPTYYLHTNSRCYWYSATDFLVARAYLALPPEQRYRFHPFVCGVNTADKAAVEHVERMIREYPDVWQGIGEIFFQRDDLANMTYGEVARASSRAAAPLFEFAADHDLPVSLHSNVTKRTVQQPIFLHEIEAMLKRHPRTRFIWCHAGMSRDLVVPSQPDHLRRLLGEYENLWLDLSWLVYDDHVAPGGKLDETWVRLVRDHPTRFMIGSDVVGRFENYVKEMTKYDLLLDALPPDVARRVGRENFLSILPARVREATPVRSR
jgi:predicted TIM-barrel fold metal-dependent hydrolase